MEPLGPGRVARRAFRAVFLFGALTMPLSQILFSFEGRIPRSTFWFSSIGLNLVNYLVVAALAFLVDDEKGLGLGGIAFIPFLIWLLAMVVVTISIQVKRWHDRGKSGCWILIGLVPIIGGIWAFIECGCLRGTEGPNQFGPDPLNPDSAARDLVDDWRA